MRGFVPSDGEYIHDHSAKLAPTFVRDLTAIEASELLKASGRMDWVLTEDDIGSRWFNKTFLRVGATPEGRDVVLYNYDGGIRLYHTNPLASVKLRF